MFVLSELMKSALVRQWRSNTPYHLMDRFSIQKLMKLHDLLKWKLRAQ
jgi:hypothetical protein